MGNWPTISSLFRRSFRAVQTTASPIPHYTSEPPRLTTLKACTHWQYEYLIFLAVCASVQLCEFMNLFRRLIWSWLVTLCKSKEMLLYLFRRRRQRKTGITVRAAHSFNKMKNEKDSSTPKTKLAHLKWLKLVKSKCFLI